SCWHSCPGVPACSFASSREVPWRSTSSSGPCSLGPVSGSWSDSSRSVTGERDYYRCSMRVPLLALAVAAAAAAFVSSAPGRPVNGAPHCRLFPSSNPWNQRVDHLPLAARSAAIVRSIGLKTGLHPDFGSGTYAGGPIGIPYTTVSGDQKKVPVHFHYASESDKGPYPIPK